MWYNCSLVIDIYISVVKIMQLKLKHKMVPKASMSPNNSMVPKASKSRKDSVRYPHNIPRRTRLKLHECRREQRLKCNSVNPGSVDSLIESVSLVGKNISAPLYPKRKDHGVRAFHWNRTIPVEPISNNTKKSFTSRKKQRKFLKQVTTSTKHMLSDRGNYLSTRVYKHKKKRCYGVRANRGLPDGQVNSFSERQNPSSTFSSKSLKLDENLKPLFRKPVANDIPEITINNIKRCSGNYIQIEKPPSCSSTGTSKHPSPDIKKLVLGFIRNNPFAVNICRSLASSTTSSSGRSYSQSLNLPLSHSIPKNHFGFEERGYYGTISKNINPSVFACPIYSINPNETSSRMSNFSQQISRNTAPNSYLSVLNETGCTGTTSKSIKQFSPSSLPLSDICPIRISSQGTNSGSPCSTVAEVGSRQITPEIIPILPSRTDLSSLPSKTDLSSLPRTYPHSSIPNADVPYNSLGYQTIRKESCCIPDGNVCNINHIYGHSYRHSLMKNFAYPKSVSETNGQINTSPKGDKTLKASAVNNSKNQTHLHLPTESFFSPGICQQLSEAMPQTQYNSVDSKFTTSKESCYISDGNKVFNQICNKCLNTHRLPFMENFVYPISVAAENAKGHNSPSVNNTSKRLSLDHHQKRLYSCQSLRTPPTNTSFPWVFNSGENILFSESNYETGFLAPPNTSNSQSSYETGFLAPPNTSNSQSSYATVFLAPPNTSNLQSNYKIGFLAKLNSSNSQSNFADSSLTENIVSSISEYFDFLPSTSSTESSEMSISSNEPNSEYSDQTDQHSCQTKISKLISCFTACFRPFCPEQDIQT